MGRQHMTQNDFNLDPPLERHKNGKVIKPSCFCDECHKEHIKENTFIDNALYYTNDFPCCLTEIHERAEKGFMCKKHPYSYFEVCKDLKGNQLGTYCEQCDKEDSNQSV